MREIKFRLRVDKAVVGYEKWSDFGLPHAGGFSEPPCWVYSYDSYRWTPNYIWNNRKDQYTGLKDKNGKEIYEGDRIRTTSGNVGIVYHSNVTCWHMTYYLKDNPNIDAHYRYDSSEKAEPLWKLCQDNRCEVIGNIYENPELVEENK